MSQTVQLDPTAGAAGFALLCMFWLVGLAFTIYWMVVAWRFMRAHERLANAADRIAADHAPPPAVPKLFGP